MLTWLKNRLFRKRPKLIGECITGDPVPERDVAIALTFMTSGTVSAYPMNENFDIHIYEARDEKYNGYYQIPLADVDPLEVWGMTLDEFTEQFKVTNVAMEEVE